LVFGRKYPEIRDENDIKTLKRGRFSSSRSLFLARKGRKTGEIYEKQAGYLENHAFSTQKTPKSPHFFRFLTTDNGSRTTDRCPRGVFVPAVPVILPFWNGRKPLFVNHFSLICSSVPVVPVFFGFAITELLTTT
tara:strand:- start:417 stop:821 length:405 start_codon:yes stop_codon:yes gene_type:complete